MALWGTVRSFHIYKDMPGTTGFYLLLVLHQSLHRHQEALYSLCTETLQKELLCTNLESNGFILSQNLAPFWT